MGERKRKVVGLAEVAGRLGVSLSTVSMALADHPRIGAVTRRRVREVAREMGYRRPRDVAGRDALARGVSRVGFLLVGGELTDEVNGDLLEAVVNAAGAAGVRIELAAVPEPENMEMFVERARGLAQTADGLILTGWVSEAMARELQGRAIPFVVAGHMVRGGANPMERPAHVVTPNEMGMGRLATARLIASGKKRVGFYCEALTAGLCHDNWLTGYRLAHAEAGMAVDPALICVAGRLMAGGKPGARWAAGLRPKAMGYVIPDARIGRLFVDEMAALGYEVGTDELVIGESTGSGRLKMGKYGRIRADVGALAVAAMGHLLAVCRDPGLPGVEVLTPVRVFHLPGGGAAGGLVRV